MTRASRHDTFSGWSRFRDEVLKPVFLRIPGVRASVHAARIALNPDYRGVWRLRKERPDNLFQPYPATCPDRYPSVFAFVRDALAGVAEPHILSFGCSTGDEVFSLRRHFPQAALTGIDINPRNIRICRRRQRWTRDGNIRFVQAADAECEAAESYDAIFCMAVFRHGDLDATDAPTCGHLIRFADFERTLEGLDRRLKPGGYLCLVHSHFRFRDTTLTEGYDTALSIPYQRKPSSPSFYDRDNRRLPDTVEYDVVFRKRAPSSAERDPSGDSRAKAAAVTDMPAIVESVLADKTSTFVMLPQIIVRRLIRLALHGDLAARYGKRFRRDSI